MKRILLAAVLTSSAAAGPAPQAAVTDVVHAFAAAGDQRDVDALQPLLHADFRIVADMGPKGVATLDRATYLGMLSAGKLGGGARTVTVEDVRIDSKIATVRATMTRADAVFHTTWTLAEADAGWQIVQDAVFMEAR